MDEKLQSNMKGVGMKCFVDYYYDFREINAVGVLPDTITEKSKRSRQSHANWIFRNERELDVLRYIVEVGKVKQPTKDKALELLEQETI